VQLIQPVNPRHSEEYDLIVDVIYYLCYKSLRV
jgi:hypothetical protein